MAKKISSSDIFQGDLTSKQIKEFESLIKTLEKLEEKQKELLKISAKQINVSSKEYEQVKKNEKAINDFNQAEDLLLKTEKERVKLENKLAQVSEERYKEVAKLRVQIQEKNKAVKDEVKEELGLLDAYQKKSKRLNQLRKEYKNLVLQEGKATKETKDLLREIQDLDQELKDVDASVGQFQRNVGNYADAVKDASSSIGNFGLGAAVGYVAGKAEDFLSVSKEAGDNAKKSLAPVLATLQVTLQSLVSLIPTFVNQIQQAFTRVELLFAETSNIFGGNEEKVRELEQALFELELQGADNLSISEAFKDFGKRVDETTKAIEEQVEVQREAETELLRLERSVARLVQREEALRVIADDNNRSFEERQKAFIEVQRLSEQRANEEIRLAQEQLRLAEADLDIQIKRAGINATATQILKDKTLAQKIDEEVLRSYNEALIGVTESEGALTILRTQNAKESADITRDLFEQDLDYLLDYTDNQKSINERIIADDLVTLDARKDLLEETNKLFDNAFNEQIELFKVYNSEIDANKLIQSESSGTLLEYVRSLELGEIQTQRLLEVTRDYRTGIQDLKDAQKDLNEAELESLELQKDIELQRRKLAGENVDLEAERFEDEVENIKKRISLLKEGSLERLRLEKELNDLLLEEQDRLAKEQEKKEKDRLDKQAELIEKSQQVISAILDKQTSKRIEAIDKELEANQKRQDQLRALAEQGNQDADSNLAEAEKRQAELERQKEESLQRQARIELALSALGTYTAKVDAGEANPLASTIADTQLLLQFTQSLPAFYEGTENTGAGGNLDSKGGFQAILHPNERVMTAEQNKPLEGLSNWELSNLGAMYKSGEFLQPKAVVVDNSKLEEKLDQLINKPTYLGRDYDATSKAIIETIERKGRLERNHRKNTSNGIF